MARQKRRDRGRISLSGMRVTPVAVNPETLSKKAPEKVPIWPEI
jgi:hypothetical protein